MSEEFIDQKELAKRWYISPRTLERWRWEGLGPRYVKIGGRIIYKIIDIKKFEEENTHG